ncbi:MAG: beta-Ala-His dipeptidase [Tissierellia bacterium]|nr:beta-Ala-His dipeptidase [Tissierellia bacterium]
MYTDIEPRRVHHYFQEISQIPRCTGNEKALSNYLVRFAKDHSLEFSQDTLMNVVIRKPPMIGYENAKKVILQGHMDMVCVKGTESTHDFEKDPIELIVEEGILRANNTTLGADDGIAIAMGLAILESDLYAHPALELLATVSEETDISGALGLSRDMLKGDYLINIDSEEEGILTVGSAGGVTLYVTHRIQRQRTEDKCIEFLFDGLKGGHSGMEINSNRGNMLKVMAAFVRRLSKDKTVSIISFVSGTLDNAIPSSGRLILSINELDEDQVQQAVRQTIEQFIDVEGEISIQYQTVDCSEQAWSREVAEDVLTMIEDIPNGVNTLVKGSDQVESSNNLALIREEDGQIYLEISLRSSDEEILEELVEKCTQVLEKNNFDFQPDAAYPSWKYSEKSELRDRAEEVYRNLYGKDFETVVVHAGLECGAISSKYPHMDMISIGPNIRGAHTPEEYMELASANRVFDYLIALLRALK